MKNLNLIWFYVTFIFILSPNLVVSQSTSGNNNTGVGKFLGYNGAQSLDFRTNNINRMRLMETGTAMIDGYAIDNSGFLGLSTDPLFLPKKSPTLCSI